MNLELCNKCPNKPDYYKFLRTDENGLVYLGYYKFFDRKDCLLLYTGEKFPLWNELQIKPENFLTMKEVRPYHELFCPYYVEQEIEVLNHDEHRDM